MKKILFVATVDSHIRHFHIPYLKYFKDQGYEVHVATSDDEHEKFDYCDNKHKIDFMRSPFKKDNIKAYKEMLELLENEKFNIIHCHTPTASVITRLAVRKLRKGVMRSLYSSKDMQVIYTAHGFHFFKGAPLKYWAIFYNIEKWLSKYTDKLITINSQDFEYAKKFKAKKVYKIEGVGVDASKFNFNMTDKEKASIREELSYITPDFDLKEDDTIITYVAEFIDRKNQDMIIDIMKNIVWNTKDDNSNEQCLPEKIKLLLVGTGVNRTKYENKIKDYGLEKNVLITGYRNDVPKILKISDIAISCSKHEGLPFNLVEAQMCGLPIVATDCRGNDEVVEENQTGYLISDFNKEKFENKLLKLCNSKSMRERMGKNAIANSKKFKLSRIIDEMKKIYEEEV